MTLIELINNHPIITLLLSPFIFVFGLVISLYLIKFPLSVLLGILKFIAGIHNRFWSFWTIRKHGYPPEHCTVDGSSVITEKLIRSALKEIIEDDKDAQ